MLLRALIVSFLLLLPGALADETRADCEKDPATDGAVRVCEGEHWDGQDRVSEGDFLPVCDTSRACLADDPNDAPGGDPFAPAAFRAGVEVGDGAAEAYGAASVVFVGRAAVYVGACDGRAGLEGAASCRGAGEARLGAYARDDTPTESVLRLVSGCAVSQGCAQSGSDCDHATYEAGRRAGDPSRCERDNTALGAMLVLP